MHHLLPAIKSNDINLGLELSFTLTRSIARPLCDSRATCFITRMLIAMNPLLFVNCF